MNSASGMDVGDLDARMKRAIHELKEMIRTQFPTTTFEVVQSPDDPESLHLLATADVDDPDIVGDMVVDRVVTLQVEEGIPLHVIPLRTPERMEKAMASHSSGVGQRAARLWGGA